MLRLTPTNYHKVVQADKFDIAYGGAEANVISSLSTFGHNTKFITKLPDNNIGFKVIKELRANNIDTKDILIGEGRLGIYFLESGYGLRGSEVIYDRKYSAISMVQKEEIDIENILEGVSVVHISGITPALSKELYEITMNLVKKCKACGVLVCFDSNYRSKLWSLEEAKKFLEEVLPFVDIAFLGDRDISNILKIKTKNNENNDYDSKLHDFYNELFIKYPNIRYAACTKRTVNSISNNSLKGYLFDGNTLYNSKEYSFDILDRVGGGDAFTAGILHGLLTGMEENKTVEFGTVASSLKHSIIGDTNIVEEESVLSIIDEGLENIKR